MVVRRVSTMEEEERRVLGNGMGGSAVEEVCGCVEGFNPELGWHGGLDK